MKEKPKFKIGDKVIVNINNKNIPGEIYVVDKYGTFEDPSDASYDVMIQYESPNNPGIKEDCLMKHCSESIVKYYENK